MKMKLFLFVTLVTLVCADPIWTKLGENLPPVQNFGGHKSCLINDKIYVFGGVIENRSLAIDFDESPFVKFHGSLMLFDLHTETWSLLIDENLNVSKPFARVFFGMACSDDKIWIFGGLHPGSNFPLPADDFWEYDISSNTFTQIAKVGIWPLERSANILKYYKIQRKEYLVLYGGASMFFSQLNDTWIYDLQHHVWSKISTNVQMGGNINPMSTIYKNELFIYGGEREPYPQSAFQSIWRWAPEVFAFDLASRTWRVVFDNANENAIINRAYAGAASVGKYFLFFSGDYGVWRNQEVIRNLSSCNIITVGVDYLVPEVVHFDLRQEKWFPSLIPEYQAPISPFKISKSDPLNVEPKDGRLTVSDPNSLAPSALKRTDMVCGERKCYITGGWGGIGSGLPNSNQFYNNHVWEFRPLNYL